MTRTLTAEVENQQLLSKDEITVLSAIAYGANPEYHTLDDAEKFLKMLFPDWYVYRGGNHVALIRGGHRHLIIRDGSKA